MRARVPIMAEIIRRMTDEDVEALAAIEEATFSMPWKPDDFREMIVKDEVVYLVVEEDGEIVGGAGIRNILGDGEITNVVIREDRRHRGYGYKLLTRLLEEGHKLGANDYTLEVRAGNENAIALYSKLGFVSEGRRKGFYDKPKEDALILWKRAVKNSEE